ncbi:MAG: F0F1 ATP synthase subunit epsilon [Thermodesulfobacteriota bacterium]
MTARILLEVVTPEKFVVSDGAEYVAAPGIEGEFGVLPGHTPFLSALKVGSLRYKDEKGQERCVFINGGFAEVLPDKVTVLAETAERRSDIDVERAKAALERARKRLEEHLEGTDFERAQEALLRAQTRISLSETRRTSHMQ